MNGEKSPEPSIEEILASIRKIISDDEPEAETAHEDHEPEEEVLELTEVVLDIDSEPQPHDIVHEERAIPETPPVITSAESPKDVAPILHDSTIEDIASAATVAAASDAFAKLSHTIPPAPEPILQPAGGKSVEDIVRELLRPILRQWIDQNLAGIVERSVERELRKISRKAEDS